MLTPLSPPLSAVETDISIPPVVEPLHVDRPPGVVNRNSSPPFSKLTTLFEALRSERKPERRKTLVLRWFGNWREKVGTDFYPALRLILPEKDRERAAYGLKEATLAKCFLATMGIDPKSTDGKRVLNWKRPTPDNPTVGDFATTMYEVLAPRSTLTHGSLTVDRLNELLDDLTKVAKNMAMQMRVIGEICSSSTATEQTWIVRIILKDLAVQVRETTVLGAFHPDARDLFNTCSDLKRVAWELWDPKRSLRGEECSIILWTPFQPMLCKRARTLAEAVKIVRKSITSAGPKLRSKNPNGEFIIEEKLDGERMQLHKRGNQYFYSSRKGKDYTYLYGAHVGTGSLTPYIHAAFDERVEDCILDGEMMVWDPELDKYLGFGTLKTAAIDQLGRVGAKDDDSPRPCFKVFDILLLRSRSQTSPLVFSNTPLRDRRGCLTKIFAPVPGRFELATQGTGTSVQDVEAALEKIIEQRGEGLVLKTHESPYVLAGREPFWVKVKPEYVDSMSDSVDLLVVAGTWGSGRRGGKVSALVCAVRDDYSEVRETEAGLNIYATICRIGSGISIDDYDWINKKKWIRVDRRSPPSHIKASAPNKREDKGDVYLDPEDWFIVSVKAASIGPSDEFGTNLTMRFPRCKAIRRDLSVDDCLAWSELRELQGGGKRKDIDEQEREEQPKKRKMTVRKKTTLSLTHQAANVKNLEVVSKLFEDMRFLVIPDLSSSNALPKPTIEKLIYENGGDFTQLFQGDESLTIIYGGTKLVPQVKRAMSCGEMDIIKPQWIVDSIERGQLAPLQSKYYFFATDAAMKDRAYNLDDEKADASQRKRKPEPPEMEEAEISDEYEELCEYLQPVSQNEDISHIPDDPSDTETESESGDRAYDFSDDDWTEVAAPTRSGPRGSVVEGYLDRVPDRAQEPPRLAPSDIEPPTVVSAARSEVSSTKSKSDQNLFFRHLCFYLDSPENARDQDFIVSTPQEVKIKKSLDRIQRDILVHGGLIATSLTDPRLTHVVLHELDKSRRVELQRRTAKPKRKYMVMTDFVDACVSENTLLDEDAFIP